MARRIRKRRVVLGVFLVLGLVLGRFVYVGLTMKPGSDLPRIAEIRALAAAAQGATEADYGSARDGWEELAHVLSMPRDIQLRHQDIHADWVAGDDVPFGPVDPSALESPDAPPEVVSWTLAALNEMDAAGIPEKLDAALAKPLHLAPIESGPDGVGLPTHDVIRTVNLRDALAWDRARFRMAVAIDDTAAAERIVHRLLECARVALVQPGILNALIGRAACSAICGELRDAAIAGKLPPVVLRRLADALDDRLKGYPSTLGFEGERLINLAMIDWCYSDNGRGDGRAVVSRARLFGAMTFENEALNAAAGTKAAALVTYFLPSRKEAIAKVNELYDGVAGLVETPLHLRGSESFDYRSYYRSLGSGYFISDLWEVNFRSILSDQDRFLTAMAGTRAFLLLEAMRLETGAPPESLSVLGDAAIDPMTGKQFGYRLMEPARETSSRGYVLYAIGADLSDDNAAPGYWSFVLTAGTKEGIGKDWVISEPDPE